jgi:hypothetical protein
VCRSALLFDKYDADDLEICEIEQCGIYERFQRERFWVEFYKGLNVRLPILTPEERVAYRQKYREAHRDAHRAYMENYNAVNREAINASMRELYRRRRAEKDLEKQNKE